MKQDLLHNCWFAFRTAKSYRPSVFTDKKNYDQQLKELDIEYRKKVDSKK